jgi:hypothetical protein
MGSAACLTNSLLPVEIVQSHDKIVLAHLDGGFQNEIKNCYPPTASIPVQNEANFRVKAAY